MPGLSPPAELGDPSFPASGVAPAPRRGRVAAEAVCAGTLLAVDALSFAVAHLGAAWLASLLRAALGQPEATLSWAAQLRPELPALVALFCAVVAYLAARGCYSERLPFWSEMRLVVLVATAALLVEAFAEVVLKDQPSRLVLVGGWLLFPPCVAVARTLAKRTLTAAGVWQVSVLVVGGGDGVANVVEVLGSERPAGYRVVAICGPDQALELTRGGGWSALLDRHAARRLVLALPRGSALEASVVPSILREGLPFLVMPPADVLPVVGGRRISFFSHDTELLSFGNNLVQPAARLAKTAFDLVAASVLLMVLLPVFAAVAVLVRRDGGPAFFSHRRVGAGGRNFGCLKFRTMVPDAAEILRRSLAADPALAEEWHATQKLRHDPRITPVGRVLRASSLDELPQLINVLRLEMSLVGPRPIVDQEVGRYGDDIAFYYESRPGLTGLWQVSGRADTSYVRRVKLDCWYAKNWTMWHDVAILAKTIPAVIGRRGAH